MREVIIMDQPDESFFFLFHFPDQIFWKGKGSSCFIYEYPV